MLNTRSIAKFLEIQGGTLEMQIPTALQGDLRSSRAPETSARGTAAGATALVVNGYEPLLDGGTGVSGRNNPCSAPPFQRSKFLDEGRKSPGRTGSTPDRIPRCASKNSCRSRSSGDRVEGYVPDAKAALEIAAKAQAKISLFI